MFRFYIFFSKYRITAWHKQTLTKTSRSNSQLKNDSLSNNWKCLVHFFFCFFCGDHTDLNLCTLLYLTSLMSPETQPHVMLLKAAIYNLQHGLKSHVFWQYQTSTSFEPCSTCWKLCHVRWCDGKKKQKQLLIHFGHYQNFHVWPIYPCWLMF